jgi:hypothetical protein
MKLIFENWRKLSEGEVVNLYPKLSAENVKLINEAEDEIFKIIDNIYRQNYEEIPVEIIESVESVLGEITETLTK